ncbi:MAG TPA: hypothetical protein VJ872_11570 [Nocardioides sp.]|nr:hypothetical protein [Nocardioides sp.]
MRRVLRGVAPLLVVLVAGCGSRASSGAPVDHPDGAPLPRLAVTRLLDALEHRDGPGMRELMTPMAQQNADLSGGVLHDLPQLSSYRIVRSVHEDPSNNASPSGSLASLRYTVDLTPAAGFDNDDTSGSAYGILVAETPDRRWLVAELGGGG